MYNLKAKQKLASKHSTETVGMSDLRGGSEHEPLLRSDTSQRRRRNNRKSRGYSLNDPREDIGSCARQQTRKHAERLQEQENQSVNQKKGRPQSIWEENSLKMRSEEPAKELSHQPNASAAQALSTNQAYVAGENLETPFEAVRTLNRRAKLVKSTDFFFSEKKTIAEDERKKAQEMRHDLTCLEELWYAFTKSYESASARWSDFLGNFELWGTRLVVIEGKFGTAVGSYFVFLRFLILLNTILSLMELGFLVVPQILNGIRENPESFHMSNILLGDGYLSNTILFISGYSNELVGKYDLQFAYFVVYLGTLLASLWIIIARVGKRLGDTQALSGKASWCPYSLMTFTGWDFAICSRNAVSRKRQGISRTFVELLAEDNRSFDRTTKQLAGLWIIRAFLNVIVGVILGGAIYLVYYLSQKYVNHPDTLKALYPAIALTALNGALPWIFSKIADLERWESPRTNLRLNLARSFILRATGVYLIVISVFTDDAQAIEGKFECWETNVGKEVYRLLLVDTLINLIMTLIYDTSRKLMFIYGNRCLPSWMTYGAPQFQISDNVLSVIYRQALVWVGIFYSPLLPLVANLCNILLFVVKDRSMSFSLHPPRRVFRASNNDNFVYMMLLATLFLAAGPVVYSLAQKLPSTNPICSPFFNLESFYSVIPTKTATFPPGVRESLEFVGTPGFVFSVVLILWITAHYYRSLAISARKTARQLEVRLMKEQEDKRALLKAYNRDSVRYE